jgi:hypothetical protein
MVDKAEREICEICKSEGATETEFGKLCDDCYQNQLAAHLDLTDML